jgi:uncharacterized damage-inducible protein DinB
MRLLKIVVIVVCAYSTALTAQAPANPISDAIRNNWNGAKRNLLGSAKVMPEAKYGFRPVETVRTFGAILAHVAGANFEFCSAARGEKTPHAEDEFEKNAKTPAAIVKALQDSMDYCDVAYKALTDRTAVEMINAAFGGGKEPRAAALIGNTGHNLEHYGNLVTYLRINGLVPPSSAPSR